MKVLNVSLRDNSAIYYRCNITAGDMWIQRKWNSTLRGLSACLNYSALLQGCRNALHDVRL